MNCPECGAPLDAEQEQVREATECETVAGIVAWLREIPTSYRESIADAIERGEWHKVKP